MRLTLLMTVLVVGLLGTTQGQRDGQKRPTRPMGGRPNSAACDLSKARNVPEATKTLVKEVLDSKANVSQLLSVIEQLPALCLRYLQKNFEESAGMCSEVNATAALCRACQGRKCGERKAMELLHTLISCVNADQKCMFISNLIKDDAKCVPMELIGALSKMSLEKKCPAVNIPACGILSLPEDDLEDYIKALNQTSVVAFLNEIEPSFVRDIPCEKVKLLARLVKSKDIFDFSQTSVQLEERKENLILLLPLLPYLAQDICANIPVDLVTALMEQISEQDFMCNVNMGRGMGQPKRGKDGKGPEHKEGGGGMCGVGDKDKGHLKQLDGRNRFNARCEFKCGLALVETILANSLNISHPADRKKLGSLRKCVPADQLAAAAQPGQCGDFDADQMPKGGRGGREIAKKCRPAKDPGNWTREDVRNMRCTLTQQGASVIKDLSKDALCGALGSSDMDLSGCLKDQSRVPQDFSRRLASKCVNGTMNKDTFRGLGKAGVYARCDALQSLSADDLAESVDVVQESLEEMRNTKQRGSKGKASCLKIKLLPLDKIFKSRALADNLPLKDFSAKTGNDKAALRKALGIDDGLTPDLPRAQKRKAFQILKGSTKLEDMDRAQIMNMSSLVTGMPTSALRQIKQTDRLAILQDMCSFDGWDQKQAVELGNGLEAALMDYNPENAMSEMSESMVEDLSDNCLKGLGRRIANLSDEACHRVCERLGGAEDLQCWLNPRLRKFTAKVCVQCLGAETRDLTEEDVLVLGQLLLEVEHSVLEKVPVNLLMQYGKLFSNLKCIPKNVTEFIQGKVNSNFQKTMTADDLQNLGAWAAGLPSEKVDTAVYGDVAASISDYLEDKPTDMCCMRTMKADDQQKVKDDIKRRKAAQVKVIQTDSAAPARRRRRDVNPLLCTSILKMASAATQLSTEELNTLTETEFVDCLQTLGDLEGWTKEQLDVLMSKFKQFKGSTLCSLSSDDLQTMGSIAYAMTKAEVECLDFLSIDAMSNLGELKGWSDDHKKAFAARYLKTNNNVAPSSLDSQDLIAMGNFLCGLTAEEIGKILPAAYGGASSHVGRIGSCGIDQLMALANLAKHSDNFGPVSGWTAAEYDDVGIVVAGLSGTEMKAASSDSIEGWTPNAVKFMKVDNLKMLTVVQLGSLSPDQAYAIDITGDSFSKEQKDAILTARASFDGSDADTGDGGDGNTSGGEMLKSSLSGLVIMMVYLLL